MKGYSCLVKETITIITEVYVETENPDEIELIATSKAMEKLPDYKDWDLIDSEGIIVDILEEV